MPHDKTNKMACAPSEDSDQPGHLPSLRCLHEETLDPQLSIERTEKTQIRLSGCPGWYESSLGTQVILLILLWGSSILECKKHDIADTVELTTVLKQQLLKEWQIELNALT